MSARAVFGIVSFCLAMTGVFLANMTTIMMIGEINRKRKEGEQLSYFGSSFRLTAILAEYHRHYPDGNLGVIEKAAMALAFLGMLSAAVCARVIGLGEMLVILIAVFAIAALVVKSSAKAALRDKP